MFAIERLIDENPACASQLTLTSIESKRYMDDLLSFDSFDDLKLVTQESKALFESRGFKLRKWVANSVSKSVLLNLPPEDLGANDKEIDLTSHLMPDSKALGLVWDEEGDRLRVCSRRKLVDVSTRREMLSVLASQYDPLGFLAPCFLGGKLILQKVTSSGLGWDEILPGDGLSNWIAWAVSVEPFLGYFVPRCCFPEDGAEIEKSKVSYQLHGFSDPSNSALSCVVYLRRVVEGRRSCVAFIQGKSRVVLVNQSNLVISRKEVKAAVMCSELMKSVSESLQHLGCGLHFWTDSHVVLRWIINPNLNLPRFVKRRIDKIHSVASAEIWKYVNTCSNPADVGTREDSFKKSPGHTLWINGPKFLWQTRIVTHSPSSCVSVKRLNVDKNLLVDSKNVCALDKLIEVSPDLYTLKKRLSYLICFKQYVVAKARGLTFKKPMLNADMLEDALTDIIKYVQSRCFGAVQILKRDSADAFDAILKRINQNANNVADMKRVSELKTLRNLSH